MYCGAPCYNYVGMAASPCLTPPAITPHHTVLRLYSIPPRFNEELAVLAANMLPWACLMHVGVAIWMYGNNDVLKSVRWCLASTAQPPTRVASHATAQAGGVEHLGAVRQ